MRAIILALLLLAVTLSLTSTLALQSAAVQNAHTISITSTDAALLALAPGTGGSNASNTVRYDPATMSTLLFDFRNGWNGSTYGFEANLTSYQNQFRYRGLFTVTNQSAAATCVSVHVNTGAPEDLLQIRMRPLGAAGDGTQVAEQRGSYVGCVNLLAGQTYEVDIWWQVVSAAPLTGSFNIRVQGTGP